MQLDNLFGGVRKQDGAVADPVPRANGARLGQPVLPQLFKNNRRLVCHPERNQLAVLGRNVPHPPDAQRAVVDKYDDFSGRRGCNLQLAPNEGLHRGKQRRCHGW